MAFVGMTPDQVDSAANGLRGQAQELQAIKTRVQNLVTEASAHWDGNDIKTFRTVWNNTYKPRITSAIDRLNSMAAELSKQATQQRTTSGDSPGKGQTTPMPPGANRPRYDHTRRDPSDEPGPSPYPMPPQGDSSGERNSSDDKPWPLSDAVGAITSGMGGISYFSDALFGDRGAIDVSVGDFVRDRLHGPKTPPNLGLHGIPDEWGTTHAFYEGHNFTVDARPDWWHTDPGLSIYDNQPGTKRGVPLLHGSDDFWEWNGKLTEPPKLGGRILTGAGGLLSGVSLVADIHSTVENWDSMKDDKLAQVSAGASIISDAAAATAGIGATVAGLGSKALMTSPLTKAIPGLNIASNIASAVSDGADAIASFRDGNIAMGVLNSVEALADVASCIPGPIGIVGTGLSLALHLGESLAGLFGGK